MMHKGHYMDSRLTFKIESLLWTCILISLRELLESEVLLLKP